jgi:Tubulin-tyrosine ligase family
LRTSSEEFTLTAENIENKFIHLTNNAVQKYSDNYGQFESGNQLSFNNFDAYCRAHGLELDVKGKVIPRIKELIQISMESVKKVINPNDSKYAFEVFGYDFMIDSEGNVWLIEVNTNPCIELSSPLLAQLIPRMLGNILLLVLTL